ncbi:IclR family transcriptional regulator C-terminal domain-containing protein [Streptomyces sp. NPDC089919]|uniref:IclR family transcriptional regulator n=1 Tax=Streptomyces sp. NPDC089919 TaxID=3155188 RepID=UPI003421EF01
MSIPRIPTQRPAAVDARHGTAQRPAPRSGGTTHAERVFRVQQAFAQLGGEVHGLGELARASGVDDSSVHRILRSGLSRGAFLQVGRGRYRLGPSAARLGAQALMNSLDVEALPDRLGRLHRATEGGLTFLFGLNHFGRLQRHCVDMAVGDSDLSEFGAVRDMLVINSSLRVGAAGRAILAHLPEAMRRRAISEPLPPGVGPGAFHDRERLLASLAEIRAKGYAVGLQECMSGWNSLAAPVLWGDTPLGAVVVMKPAVGAAEPIERYVLAVRAAAADLGRHLGSSESEACVTALDGGPRTA